MPKTVTSDGLKAQNLPLLEFLNESGHSQKSAKGLAVILEILAIGLGLMALAICLWAVREQKKTALNIKAQLELHAHDQFKSLAATALESNNRQFIDLAKSIFEKETTIARSDLEHLIKPLEQTLQRYEIQVRDLEKDRQKTFFTLEHEIKKVVETSQQLSLTTAALKDALKKPHVRGRWGEVQLKNCVELAGMSEYCDVVFQNVTTDAEGERAIPDMIVRMPGGRIIVVDCKTPIDAFLASLESTSEQVRITEMQRHGRHVKDHVRRLSSRAYPDILKDTPDFTILFLPNESFLYAALETEPDVMEYALQKKVIVATPPTLIGLLKVIRFGWNEEKLTQNALQISEAGKELHKRLVEFSESFEGIGKHIEKVKLEYDTSRRRLEQRVLGQARKMETLGVKSAKSLPESLIHD